MLLQRTFVTHFIIFLWTINTSLGADITNKKAADAGLILAETLRKLLDRWSHFVPDGLEKVGYGSEHLDTLVKGTLPQRKVIDVSPRQPTPDDLHLMLSNSMKLFS